MGKRRGNNVSSVMSNIFVNKKDIMFTQNLLKKFKKKESFAISVNDKTYDLVPLIALVMAYNHDEYVFCDMGDTEVELIMYMRKELEKKYYKESVVGMKPGLINRGDGAWHDCVSDIVRNIFDKRGADFYKLVSFLRYRLLWNYAEIAKYVALFKNTLYIRGVEKGVIASKNLALFLSEYVLYETKNSYMSTFKNHTEDLDWATKDGLEILLAFFIDFFANEENCSQDTKDFMTFIITDVQLCKILKCFEITDGIEKVDYTTQTVYKTGEDSESINDLVKYVSQIDFDFEMRLRLYVNQHLEALEREDILKSKEDLSMFKDAEIKKLNSAVKKLEKELRATNSVEVKSKEIIKELRSKLSTVKESELVLAKEEEIETLKDVNKESDAEIKKLKTKLDSALNRISTLENRKISTDEDSKIMLNDLDYEVKNLRSQLEYYENMVNSSLGAITFEDIQEEIKDLKICVIGGPAGYDKRLVKLSDKVVHIDINETIASYDMPQSDLVIIVATINTHSHTGTAKKLCRARGIPYLQVSVVNIELLGRLIYDFKKARQLI